MRKFLQARTRLETPFPTAAVCNADNAAQTVDESDGHNTCRTECSPFDTANWLSKLTIWWLNPLVQRGYSQPLTERDVWPLPQADRSEVLTATLDRFYQREKAKRRERQSDGADESLVVTPIHGPIWSSTKGIMQWAIVVHLVGAACSIIQPLLIKALLLYFQGSDNMFHITSPYTLACVLIATTVGSVMCGDFGMFLTMRAGLNARIIVVDSVFQKILRLTTSARQSFTSGDIITLAGVDSDRLFEAFWVSLWAVLSPLMITIVCILIGVEMG